MAAIIVLGLGILAVAIGRISGQTAVAASRAGLSVQAFYAADSGAQYGMNQVFFSASDRATADANCLGFAGANLNYSVTGLGACGATITCSISTDAGNTTSFYQLVSSATCGSGPDAAQRIVAVSAVMN